MEIKELIKLIKENDEEVSKLLRKIAFEDKNLGFSKNKYIRYCELLDGFRYARDIYIELLERRLEDEKVRSIQTTKSDGDEQHVRHSRKDLR